MRKFGMVTKLFISPQKDKKDKEEGIHPLITRIDCIENVGIKGDGNAKGGERQVTLMDDSVREWVEKQSIKGLCSSKFKANITIKDLNALKLTPGALLHIGDAVLKVTSTNKKCYGEVCKIYREKLICPIPSGCYFAKVVGSGQIKLKDRGVVSIESDNYKV